MSDDRDRRQQEHDRFVAEVNLELPAAPTDHLLQRIEAADARLYERLAEGDRWINAKLDAFLGGDLDSLDNVRDGWRDWVKLYRHGLRLIGNGESNGPSSPPGTTTEARTPKGNTT